MRRTRKVEDHESVVIGRCVLALKSKHLKGAKRRYVTTLGREEIRRVLRYLAQRFSVEL